MIFVGVSGRKYEDYINFISEHPNVPTTEMDTVYNNAEGPYIQTFIFEHTGLMIGVLHSEKTADSIASALDMFQEKLENDYSKLFSLLLTDRGSEFAKPKQFEINMETGEIRNNIFYCDAQTPSQKPHVENNHNFVREILPNGMSWTKLTQGESRFNVFAHKFSTKRFSRWKNTI